MRWSGPASPEHSWVWLENSKEPSSWARPGSQRFLPPRAMDTHQSSGKLSEAWSLLVTQETLSEKRMGLSLFETGQSFEGGGLPPPLWQPANYLLCACSCYTKVIFLWGHCVLSSCTQGLTPTQWLAGQPQIRLQMHCIFIKGRATFWSLGGA